MENAHAEPLTGRDAVAEMAYARLESIIAEMEALDTTTERHLMSLLRESRVWLGASQSHCNLSAESIAPDTKGRLISHGLLARFTGDKRISEYFGILVTMLYERASSKEVAEARTALKAAALTLADAALRYGNPVVGITGEMFEVYTGRCVAVFTKETLSAYEFAHEEDTVDGIHERYVVEVARRLAAGETGFDKAHPDE